MEKIDKAVKKRRKIKFSSLLILFVLVCIVAFIIFRLSVNSKLKAGIDAFRAAGYPATCEELDRWYKLPDGEDNAAYIILDVFSFYQQWDKDELQALPVVGQKKLPARTEPLTDQTKILVEEYLADNRQSLELLHEAASIEYSRYPIDISLGQGTQLNHLGDIRSGIRMLGLEAVFHASKNEPQSAIQSVKAGFGLARSLKLEPLLISQLARIGCQSLTISSLERVINQTILTDEQLVELDQILTKVEDQDAIFRALVGERCFTLDIMSHPESISPEIVDGISSVPLVELYSGLGMSDWDALIYLNYVNDYIEASKLSVHQRRKAGQEIEARYAKISKIHILLHILRPALSRCVEIDLRGIALLRAAQVAIAVERYRLAEDKLPNALDQLVPGYIETIPLDPFDGKEIRYKQLDRGYVVYSVGHDLSDDDGRELPTDRKERQKNPKWDVTFIVEK